MKITPSIPMTGRKHLLPFGFGLCFWTLSLACASGFWMKNSHASFNPPAAFERAPASLAFPRVRQESDADDILDSYPAYLEFVLEVGRQTDLQTAKRLNDTFKALVKRDRVSAARFLKGLRFEMLQKLELMGSSTKTVSTRTPEMRRWIGKYMKEWLREADEHLFRSVVMKR